MKKEEKKEEAPKVPPPEEPNYETIELDEKRVKELKLKIQKLWPLFVKKGYKTIRKEDVLQILSKLFERTVESDEYDQTFIDPNTKRPLESIKKLEMVDLGIEAARYSLVFEAKQAYQREYKAWEKKYMTKKEEVVENENDKMNMSQRSSVKGSVSPRKEGGKRADASPDADRIKMRKPSKMDSTGMSGSPDKNAKLTAKIS